jgi:hypothetical protein
LLGRLLDHKTVAARGFMRLGREHLETGESGLASSLLPFLAGGEKQRHLQT